MEIRTLGISGSPGRIETRIRCAFHAKEIYAPFLARIETARKHAHGQRKLGSPDLVESIDRGPRLHATIRIALAVQRNFQVNPLSVRTDFELPVAPRMAGILQENFCNVAIPE